VPANKIVIIINGNGGVGKDTLCKHAASVYSIKSVSSITPIKEIALLGGWDGEKSQSGRKLLVDLKKAFVEYNDLPTIYLGREYQSFLRDNNEILFVHIREASEIDKFRKNVITPCVTLLATRETGAMWLNESDNNVGKYVYDYTFSISEEKEITRIEFLAFLKDLLAKHLAH
jgi:cytidylate kinase